MPKLIELLNKNKLTLMAALPENNAELIEAAASSGADALQLPVDIKDFKKDALKKILRGLKLPVGAAIGHKESLTKKITDDMVEMGFDFINAGLEHLSPPLMAARGISKVLALNSRYSLDEVVMISQKTFQALDAAIISASDQGKNLVIGDLQNYISIILSSGIPVIVPTQRNIHPSEVAIIADTGARGILLTSTVTGTTAKHIEKAIREFRVAIDDLAE